MHVAGHVSGLNIYPVKSGRGIALESARVAPMGLLHDRQWMIIDAMGIFLTQRDTPQLAQLVSVVDDAGGLTLAVAGHFHVHVPVPETTAPTVMATVWKSRFPARLAGGIISEKLSAWLGKTVQLVRFPEPGARMSNPIWAGPDAPVGFADAYPVLVALAESLDDLNAHLATALPMDRFRTNIVITGATAWADDTWQRIRIGESEFDLVKPCDRCLVTTTDQTTGTRTGPEPLTTLAKLRLFKVGGSNGVYFGTNAVPNALPHGGGMIHVGDSVEVLETRPSWKTAEQ
jgi:uncharacterized protein